MPVVELDIGGTPTRVQVSDGYTPEDLDHIASTLKPPEESAVSRATSYVGRKASEWQHAADTMLGGLSGVAPPENPPTSIGDIAGETATALAPAVAPGLTIAGTAAGAGTRAAGGSEGTADTVNALTQLAGGVGSALRGGFKAASGAKAAIQARYGQVAEDAAKAGKTLGAGSQFAQDLHEALDSALTHPVEKAMGNGLLAKMTAPGSQGVDYADLDNALAGLRKVRGQSYVRGLVNDAAQALLEGTPAGKARLAAQASYRGLKGKAILRGGGGLLTRGGAALYGAKELQQGNYGRGAAGLGAAVVGGMSPGALVAFGKGAVGPLARTGVALGGQIPGLELGGSPENAPASPTEPDTGPSYDTPLSPAEEQTFQAWKQRYAPQDSGADYDLRGAFKAGLTPGANGHWPDTFKKPNHPTFSNESIYAKDRPDLAGSWQGETYVPPQSKAQPVKPLPGPYGREIAAVASLVKIPPEVIQAHMRVESSGNAGAVGDSGRSIGLMQIQPGTAVQVAKPAAELLGRVPDLKNPIDNLVVGGLLLRRYLDKTNGDWNAAAQMYNGGEHTSGNPMTRQYVGKLMENFGGGG